MVDLNQKEVQDNLMSIKIPDSPTEAEDMEPIAIHTDNNVKKLTMKQNLQNDKTESPDLTAKFDQTDRWPISNDEMEDKKGDFEESNLMGTVNISPNFNDGQNYNTPY